MMFRSPFVTSGMGLGVLFRTLVARGISLRPLVLLRLLSVTVVGSLTTVMAVLTAPYRLLFVRRRKLRPDPVFIVGHWRTGSTYLHELMVLDERLSAPTTLECTAPWAYPLSLLFMAPFMMLYPRKKRPMDNVRIGAVTPQEDEYALIRLTGFSPLLNLAFPQKDCRYFLSPGEPFVPEDDKARAQWCDALTYILKTAQGIRGGRPVLKNPCHTLRIDLLRRLFPEASFIHIRRDPSVVIPSTRRMWSILGPKNVLKGEWRDPSMEEIIDGYNHLERAADAALETVPSEKKIEIRFEDLERDPAAVLMQIYDRFGWTVSCVLERKWEKKRKSVSGYQKNRYALTPAEEVLIASSVSSSGSTP